MAALREDESRILGLLADNPQKYADLLDLLHGDARRIGEGLINDIPAADDATADAVRETKAWAQQSRVRTAR